MQRRTYADQRLRVLCSSTLLMSAVALWSCGGGSAADSATQGAVDWGPPTTLQTGTVGPVYTVVDESGAATLFWDVYSGLEGVYLPQASRSVAGSDWTSAHGLESAPATFRSFSVALTDAGTGPVAIWANQDASSPSRPVLRSSSFAGSWTSPVTVPASAFNVGSSFAGNRQGTVVGVWAAPEGFDAYEVVGVRRDTSGAWSSTDSPISTNPQLVDAQPSVAMNEQGDAMALWVQGAPGRINASLLGAASTAWTAATQVDLASGSSSRPQIIALGDGRFAAAWEQTVGGRTSIHGAWYSGSAWQQSVLLEVDDRGDAGLVRLARGGANEARAVWMQPDNGVYTIWTSHFDSTTGWQQATRPIFPSTPEFEKAQPRVAMDSGGNAVAIWKSRNLSNAQEAVEYSYLTRDSDTWSSPAALSNNGARLDGTSLAMNGTGTVVVAWVMTSEDGSAVVIARTARR